MIKRDLYAIAFSETWGRQMRFITGPRQCGKTTLAKAKLAEAGDSKLYYLWDLRDVRNRYKANQLFFTQDCPPGKQKHWVCFDELHKIPKWKNGLKGIFDESFEHYQFIITGSAKFDIFRKAGDSLAGRFLTFNLFPLSLSEVLQQNKKNAQENISAQTWIHQIMQNSSSKHAEETIEHLLMFGGFPEPFLKQSKNFHTKWAESYTDTVIKEDIGELTKIIDREHLYDLYHLLPEMVGSPLSESSLSAHLETSNPTVKNHVKRLEDFYLIFKIHPYSKNIKRALLKAPKAYLYDWSQIKDPAKRFENYVAMEIYSHCYAWMNATGRHYDLFYLRNKEKEETDFLILKDKTPWLMIEAKLSDGTVASHHKKIQAMLNDIPLVQICRQDGICQMEEKNVYRISASRFFA